MSFFDKFVNGGVIALVQHLKPVNQVALEVEMLNSTTHLADHISPPPTVFYLTVLVFVSGSAVIVTFVSLFFIMTKQIRQCWLRLRGCKCEDDK